MHPQLVCPNFCLFCLSDAPAIMPSSSLDKAASPSSSRNGDDGGDVGGGAEEESGGDEVS